MTDKPKPKPVDQPTIPDVSDVPDVNEQAAQVIHDRQAAAEEAAAETDD